MFKKVLWIGLVILLFCVFGVFRLEKVLAESNIQSNSTVWYVSKNGDNSNGLSWKTAFIDLQDALAKAESGDEIWVSYGVYTPGLEQVDSFNLKSGVSLYGGFNGTETNIIQREWSENLTVLSGDIDHNDNNDDGNFISESPEDLYGNNSFHVIYVDGSINPLENSTTLDGFVVTSGKAVGKSENNFGGAFYCSIADSDGKCNPILKNIIFQGNIGHYGGALSLNINYGVSNLRIENVKFMGNSALYGGAIYIKNNLGTNEIIVNNSDFVENTSENGGAIFSSSYLGNSENNFENIIFSSNSANYGGAYFSNGYSGTIITQFVNTTFFGNDAEYGGAIFNNGIVGVNNCNLYNVILWENYAIEGKQIFNSDTNTLIDSSLIEDGLNGIALNSENSIVTDSGGNISKNPIFVDSLNGDFHLQPGSPAIDSGSNQVFSLPQDKDLNLRPIDGDWDGQANIDIGAYEFQTFCPSGNIVRVNQKVSFPNNGESWFNALPNLKNALVMANQCDNINEIWVAEGIYTPGDRNTDSFFLIPGVSLYGGFNGSESNKNERNWIENETVLSGDVDNNDVNEDLNGISESTQNLIGSNSYHVITAKGSSFPFTNETIIDGFIITGGKAQGGDTDNFGGGFYCESTYDFDCSPTLVNLIFSGNYAEKGGAVFLNGSQGVANATFENTIFSNNSALSGGAFFGHQSIGLDTPIINNSTFFGNSSEFGGAIYSMGTDNASGLNLQNVILWKNIGSFGDQIVIDDVSVSLSNCIIEGGIEEIHLNNNKGNVTVDGNIFTSDPLFVDQLDNNFHVFPESPAIDNGKNLDFYSSTDFEGKPRIIDGNFDGNFIVDIGAYESQIYTLNISSTGTGSGLVGNEENAISCRDACEMNLLSFEIVNLQAIPDHETSFNGWSGECTNIFGNCEIIMDEAKSVSAIFSKNQYDLSVEISGNGSGVVMSVPNGIYCEGECNENFDYGTEIILKAIPDAGSSFVGWNGECTNTIGDCEILIDQMKSVGAIFSMNQYDLSLEISGEGSGTVISYPEGIQCVSDCIEYFDYKTEVTLQAFPDEGSTFIGWNGACSNTSETCVITMEQAKYVNAIFAINQYELRVEISGTGNGLVKSNPDGIICDGDCSEHYKYETEVTLTVLVGEGSEFAGWSGECANISGDCTISMNETKNVKATFLLKQYELMIDFCGNGDGMVIIEPVGIVCEKTCNEKFDFGTEVVLKTLVNENSKFLGWEGDCSNTSGDCIVKMYENKSVFSIIERKINSLFLPILFK